MAIGTIWNARELLIELVRREGFGRYRRAWLGPAWALLTPLAQLASYGLAFAVLGVRQRWAPGDESPTTISALLGLFAGLVAFGLVAEVLTESATLFQRHAAYVRKVVFPLPVLPWVTVGAAIARHAVALLVLVGVAAVAGPGVGLALLMLPLWYVAMLPLLLGLSYGFSAVGAIVPDVAQALNVALTLLLFGSAVVFPASQVPEPWRWFVLANPIATAIETYRGWMGLGAVAPWWYLAWTATAGAALAWGGAMLFERLRWEAVDAL